MRIPVFISAACLVLAYTTAWSQAVQIKPGHIMEKEKFTTRVVLLNGEKYSGKLVECSDSSITLSLSKSYEDGHFYYDRSFDFDEMDNIMLKRKAKGIGTAIATPVGFGLGMAVVGIVDAATRTTVTIVTLGQAEPRKITPAGFIAGGLIGAAVGAGIGIGIDQSSRKKYVLNIHGNYDAFAANVPMLKLMVINE